MLAALHDMVNSIPSPSYPQRAVLGIIISAMDFSKITNFQDQIVTVMGLGRYKQGTGLGTTKWLMRHGAQTVVTDLKDEAELKESVDLVMDWYRKYRQMYPDRVMYEPLFVLGRHRLEDFTNAACVMLNPGVRSESEFVQAARAARVPIESDISLFFRFFPHPTVAVTGTKGKTTTTTLIGEMLKQLDPQAVMAGNIKVTPLEYMDDLLARGEATPIVLELSSWLLDALPAVFTELGHGPDIAVLTNISPDHLNTYPSYADYIKSKEIIFGYQNANQKTVLNKDHEIVSAMRPRVKGRLYWFSKDALPEGEDGAFVRTGSIVFRDGGKETEICAVADVKLAGAHNLENVLAATTAAMLRGVPADKIAHVLRSFEGVADRQEIVRELDGVTYVNDTTATAPQAVAVALQRFGQQKNVVLICGGEDKKMVFEEMTEAIVRHAKNVVLFPGTASALIETAILGKIPMEKASTMAEAVKKASKMATAGDVVLLSPGAASFNMFKNEFDRGDQFKEAVKSL